jgi:hypothetical protein
MSCPRIASRRPLTCEETPDSILRQHTAAHHWESNRVDDLANTGYTICNK